jgi:uncharacterized protein
MPLIHSWLNPKACVRISKSSGHGIFAAANILKGERVAILGGDIMTIDELNNIPGNMQEYPNQIEERFVIGSRTSKEPEDTDFFNHSCNPNVGIKGQIFLEAMRNIKKCEEITFDYAMTVSKSVGSNIVFKMKCLCRSKNCRGIITEDDWKIKDLQRRYNGYFSQYIQEKIDSLCSVA